MLESTVHFFLAAPRRITWMGMALARVRTNRHRPGLPFIDSLPSRLGIWMPESALGFRLAVLTLTLGLWTVSAGRRYERFLEI